MYDNDLNRLVNHVSLTFQKLSRWRIETKLTISMENTNFVLFHTPNKPLVRNDREIVTENMVINRADAVKYLGITIDEKLTWICVSWENAQKYSISIIEWKPHPTKQDRKGVLKCHPTEYNTVLDHWK